MIKRLHVPAHVSLRRMAGLMAGLILCALAAGSAAAQDRRGWEQFPGSRERQPGFGRAAPDPYEAEPRPMTRRERYCLQLEQELAREWNRSKRSTEILPKINAEIRKFDRIYQGSQARAERANCYEYFLFSRTLRRTRRCLRLHREIERAQQKLARLQEERQSILNSRDTSYRRDEIISALAQNGCGGQYQREARRWKPFSFLWNDEDTDDGYRGGLQRQAILPYATYRTMCVRLCDGYYFPISFSTLPSQFSKDASVCQSKCAAPAALYVYKNPGEAVEQMSSLNGVPYDKLPTAWLYRKEYVKGCSCKAAEYKPDGAGDADQDTQRPEGRPADGGKETGGEPQTGSGQRKSAAVAPATPPPLSAPPPARGRQP